MNWQDVVGNWVLVPDQPRGIIHFLGGAFIAAAPHVTYQALLEHLGHQGYVVIATPFVSTFDHRAIAETVLRQFERSLGKLQRTVLRQRYLPIYGVGHSMGCKLHLLIGSLFQPERAGNVLMAFNNYPARRSIPFFEQVFDQAAIAFEVNMEFVPSPEQTLQLIQDNYAVRRNLLIKFRTDELDQTRDLAPILTRRFDDLVTVQRLRGNHLTPIGQNLRWQMGPSFSALDAVGQWVKQEFGRDLHTLQQELSHWLNPLGAPGFKG